MYQKPNNLKFREIFDSIASKYDSITHPYAVSRRIDLFLKFAQGKCLEVGAGTGQISKALSKKHPVIATDISPKMVSEIKRKLEIKAITCDAEKLPFKNDSFDTIVGAEMIYYLDHPQRFLKECYRVLKPRGKLLLSSANESTKFYDQLRTILRKVGVGSTYFDDQNRNFITDKKLTNLLQKTHFTNIKIYKFILLPFKFLDPINRILEKTPLNKFGIFIFSYATKP